jgi:L-histidine N-alpha-methyltransferase
LAENTSIPGKVAESSRFNNAMHRALCESAAMPFADDVRAGLTAHPKTLPPKYFYDELGSALFEAITLLPEYYLTRAETEILSTRADEIIAKVEPTRLVELGSGSAVKTRYLIEAGLRKLHQLEYSAIDISQAVLATTVSALRAQYKGLTVRSYQGEYYEGLRALSQGNSQPHEPGSRALALFLGSNIGNFDPPEALRFMRAIRAVLHEDDALLLGTDLKKDRATLEAAYDDPIGLTAAFNLNILARINRELAGRFNVRTFRHRAQYDESHGRVEMHLVSSVAQVVPIETLSLDVSFTAGETIYTEASYKFSSDDVQRLAHDAGFELQHVWTDVAQRFACNLLRCV